MGLTIRGISSISNIPDNGLTLSGEARILFQANFGSGAQLYEAKASGGSDIQQITTDYLRSGKYNPVGTRISYISTGGITVSYVDIGTGLNKIQTTFGTTYDGVKYPLQLDYSEDGSRIILGLLRNNSSGQSLQSFPSEYSGNASAQVINLSAAGTSYCRNYGMHTRGTLLFTCFENYTTGSSESVRRHTIDRGGTAISSGPNVISTTTTGNYGNIGINLAETHVTYSEMVTNGSTNWRIVTEPIAGGTLVLLTDATSNCIFGSYSPDGTKILYADDVSGFYQLYTMDTDGSNKTLLLDDDTKHYTPLDWRA
jgi:hypothetical protein